MSTSTNSLSNSCSSVFNRKCSFTSYSPPTHSGEKPAPSKQLGLCPCSPNIHKFVTRKTANNSFSTICVPSTCSHTYQKVKPAQRQSTFPTNQPASYYTSKSRLSISTTNLSDNSPHIYQNVDLKPRSYVNVELQPHPYQNLESILPHYKPVATGDKPGPTGDKPEHTYNLVLPTIPSTFRPLSSIVPKQTEPSPVLLRVQPLSQPLQITTSTQLVIDINTKKNVRRKRRRAGNNKGCFTWVSVLRFRMAAKKARKL